MKCPNCGESRNAFHVELSSIAYLYQDGSIDPLVEDRTVQDLGDDTYVDCVECDWSGTLKEIIQKKEEWL